MKTIISTVGSVILLGILNLAAQSIPSSMNYQGQIQNADGTPVPTGEYDLTFHIYDAAQGGNLIWGPQIFDGQGGVGHGPRVPVVQGYFNVSLGAMDTASRQISAAFTAASRFVQITVGNRPPILPRQELLSVPFAFKAANSDKLAGYDWGSLLNVNDPVNGRLSGTKIATGTVTSGQIANGTITPADLNTPSFETVFWKVNGNGGTAPLTHFLGTLDNQPLELRVNNKRALRLEPAPFDTVNVVGGSAANLVTAGVRGATIAGGDQNSINANSHGSAIGGGAANIIAPNSAYSTINGLGNGIGMGSGGSAISGGTNNTIASGAIGSLIAGGMGNYINPGSSHSAVSGGLNNRIDTNSSFSRIAGGLFNDIGTNAAYSAIGGGQWNSIGPNSLNSTVGGGTNNTIAGSSTNSTIAGGLKNNIGAGAYSSAIGGGDNNTIADDSYQSTIAGGQANDIRRSAQRSAIGGGTGNDVGIDSFDSTIAGGQLNRIGTNAYQSAIGGGFRNDIGDNARLGTVGGGFRNQIGINHSLASTIGGGYSNTIGAASAFATIPGGEQNFATHRAFASGTRAKANHMGAFVWADSQSADFASTATNQFLIRASRGVGINRATTANALEVEGNASKTAAGSWLANSDARIKTGVATITNALETLARVRLVRFRYTDEYRAQHPSLRDRSYVNVVAQEFREVFPEEVQSSGERLPDGNEILQVDTHPLSIYAVAGVQELEKRLKGKDAEIQQLKARLDRLEQLLSEVPSGQTK